MILFFTFEYRSEFLHLDHLIIDLDDATIDAQSLLFLLAGYETSSTLLSFAVHTLATHPHIQEQLRSHIEQVTNGNDITYEMLSELTYLEKFLLGRYLYKK